MTIMIVQVLSQPKLKLEVVMTRVSLGRRKEELVSHRCGLPQGFQVMAERGKNHSSNGCRLRRKSKRKWFGLSLLGSPEFRPS